MTIFTIPHSNISDLSKNVLLYFNLPLKITKKTKCNRKFKNPNFFDTLYYTA